MSAQGWLFQAIRRESRRARRRSGLNASATRRTTPQLERLEPIALLATIQTITEPALILANAATNFGAPSVLPAKALSPALPLFNPALGTLVDVRISSSATLSSLIKSQNTSRTTGADVTANVNGNFEIDGLNAPITGGLSQTVGPVTLSPNPGGLFDFQPPAGISFDGPPGATNAMPSATSNQSFTITDPQTLAFYTASSGRTSLAATMSASATAGATAPNGNLTTQVVTTASATINVSYDYVPTNVCPVPTGIVRFGIHHQQTELVVSLSGPIDPNQARNPNNYTIIAPGADGKFGTADDLNIPIKTATFNAAKNTVTLVPFTRLNQHLPFELAVKFPCANGAESLLPFGGKRTPAHPLPKTKPHR